MKDMESPATGGSEKIIPRDFARAIAVEFSDGTLRRRAVLVARDEEELGVVFDRVTFDTETMHDELVKGVRLLSRELPCDLNAVAATVHQANEKWWRDLTTGEPIERNRGELLMLIVSEIAEAMEGERKNLMDDKLPHRRMAEVELADALIRIFDYAGGLGYDLQGALEEKMEFNATRADHTHEARRAVGGKKF